MIAVEATVAALEDWRGAIIIACLVLVAVVLGVIAQRRSRAG